MGRAGVGVEEEWGGGGLGETEEEERGVCFGEEAAVVGAGDVEGAEGGVEGGREGGGVLAKCTWWGRGGACACAARGRIGAAMGGWEVNTPVLPPLASCGDARKGKLAGSRLPPEALR